MTDDVGEQGTCQEDVLDAGTAGRYETLANAVPDGLFQIDADDRFLAVNDAFLDVTGRCREDLLDEPLERTFPEPAAAQLSAVRRELGDAKPDATTLTVSITTAEGETRPCQVRLSTTNGTAGAVGTVRPSADHGHEEADVSSGDGAGGIEAYADALDRTEARLHAKTEKFRSLVQAVEEYAIFMLDPDGRITSWNEGAAHIKDYDADDVLGEHFSLFYTDEDVQSGVPEANLATAAEAGGVEDEGWRVREDGSRFWANVTITPIYDEDGDLRGYAKVTRDMTDRKEREEALRRERDLVEQILEANPVGIAVLDSSGEIARLNEAGAEVLGIDPAEADDLDPEDWRVYDEDGDVVPPAEWPQSRALRTGDPVFDWRCELERYDGSRRWISINAVPLFDDAGAVERIILTANDISTIKGQQADLRRERDLVEQILETNPAGIVLVDEDNAILRANERAAAVTGRSVSDLLELDSTAIELFDEEGEPVPTERHPSMRALEHEGTVVGDEYQIQRPDGEWRWLTIKAASIETDEDEAKVVISARDVTALKRQQADLRRERDLVEKVIEVSPDMIGVFDADDGSLLRANARAEKLLGAREGPSGEYEYVGGEVALYDEDGDPVPPEERPFARAMETGEPVSDWQGQMESPDGDRRWFSIDATPLYEDGRVERVVVVGDDVTTLKEQAKAIERQRDELERELGEVFERVDDAFYAVDDQFRYTYVNERAEELLQHTEGELLGKSVWEVFPEAAETPAWESFHEALETQEQTSYEFYFDSLEFWVEANVYPSETGLSVYFQDVTDRKEREQELEQYRVVTQASSDAIVVIDEESTVVSANPAIADILGYEPDDLEGEPITTLMSESMTEAHIEAITRYLETGEQTMNWENVELPGRHRDGREVPLAVSINEFEHDDDRYFAGVIRDVTERKERERALEESRNRYQALVENFPNGAVALVDEDLHYTTVGGTPIEGSNATVAELEGSSLEDVLPSEMAELLVPRYVDALDGERSDFEGEFGGRVYQFSILPVRNDSGDVFAALGMSQDVTERKEHERYLEDAKAQLEAATEAGAVGTWEWHVPEDRFVAGASLAKQFGVDPDAAREGVPLERLTSSIHEADRERVASEIEAALESCGEYESEYRVWNADDELRWVIARGHVECDEDGNPTTFPGALTDITERKRAELQLQRSNEQLESLFEILPVGVVVADEDGRLIEANDTAKEIWGGDVFDADSIEEYERYSATWAESGEPIESDEWTMVRVLDGEEVTDPDVFEIEAVDGERRTVRAEGMPVRDESGEVSRGVVTITDVTERKERERALEMSERRYRTLAENFPDGAVALFDEDLRYLVADGQLLEDLGFTSDELEGKTIHERLDPDLIEIIEPKYRAALDGETTNFEIDRNGRTLQVWTVPVTDADGEVFAGMAVVEDVTERKQRERELEEYETIVETVGDGILAIDADGTFTHVNDAYASMLGYDREELIGRPADSVAGVGDIEETSKLRQQLLDGEIAVASHELELETAGGGTIPVEARFKLLPTDDGEQPGTVAVVRDVTDRVERERELERYETIVETVNDGIYVVDEDGRFTMVNEEYAAMTGYDPEELVGQHVTEVIDEEVAQRARELEAEMLSGERERATLETEVETDGGETAVAEATFALLQSEDGGHDRIGVVRDITERKERERALEESERRYRTLAENFPNGVVALFDEDLRYTAAGGQLFDHIDTSPDDPIGDRIMDRYPDALVAEVEPYFRAALAGETNSFEVEIEGWHLFAHTLPVRNADGDVYAGMLVVQNVTELREHERELEARVRQQEAVTDLGQQALEERDLDALFDEVTDSVAETLDADYCKVLELLPGGKEVLLRSGVGWQEGLVGEATVGIGLNSQAGYTLRTEEPVVVEDLATETRFSGPDLLIDHDVTSGISTIIGTPEDPWGVLGVHTTDDRGFSEHDVNFIQSVATILTTAIQRSERERDLELYETIVENIWDGVYALDPDGNFELVNEAFTSMLGYEREELLGEPASIVHSEEISTTAQQLADEALEGDSKAVTMEVELQTADGNTVPAETRFGPYPYDEERYGRTGVSRDATERIERERELKRQREELAALNRLNQVVGEITHAAVESSSREDIERLVCERLADSESYQFAWVGELDRRSDTIALRTEAGVDGYLDDVTLAVEPEVGIVGPTGNAVRTREPQIVQDTETDPDYEPWREHAREYGFRSSAAIPITYEDVTYGVLNVYSKRVGAFESYERTLLARLGTVVGHTINALERKEALMSDQVVEVEFAIPNICSLVDDPVSTDGTITFDRTVAIGGDDYLEYGTADEEAMELLEGLVDSIPFWEELTVLEERFEEVNFELRLSEPPAISLMASYGGRVESAVIEDDDYRMVVELPPAADVRAVVEALQEEYPDVELVAQRRTARDAWSGRRIDAVLEENLTDRQRASLEAAYYAGYFDTPRRLSGEEVAQSLDISAPTLHQHLRKGQRKLLATVFDGPK